MGIAQILNRWSLAFLPEIFAFLLGIKKDIICLHDLKCETTSKMQGFTTLIILLQ